MKRTVSKREATKKGTLVETVDDYLEPLPQAVRAVLEELRNVIKAAAPKADEVISYRIPTYKYHGPLVHFAAFTNHCSLIVVSEPTLRSFSNELKPYRTSGTTIQFSTERPLPAELVTRIVKARIKENELRAKKE
ncbi:MAG: hypothetical protein C4K48_03595 [Candidatus Thorarchaeota archaeon]|nr:MAG: hypothetical protein C4K48_03595 [Candidatus Thorarchaeota archaeon]